MNFGGTGSNSKWIAFIKSMFANHKSLLVAPLKQIDGINAKIYSALKVKSIAANLPWINFIGLMGLITLGGYLVLYPQKLFKPGDNIGYTLGIVGGVLMLLLLLYSLRKRYKIFSNLGSPHIWFKWHMAFGIIAPLTIIFHSTYHVYVPFMHPTGSINSAVAMYTMLIVSSSGVFGRFFYTKIHLGLYGRRATVDDLRHEMEQIDDVKSLFSFAPRIEQELVLFNNLSEKKFDLHSIEIINFLCVSYKTAILIRSLSKQLHEIMHQQAVENNYSELQFAEMEQNFLTLKLKIKTYLQAHRNAAQFHSYERLFSKWHIFHIPMVYLLVLSGFYHVYAVTRF
jgi:hypothetical protein